MLPRFHGIVQKLSTINQAVIDDRTTLKPPFLHLHSLLLLYLTILHNLHWHTYFGRSYLVNFVLLDVYTLKTEL